MTNTDRSKAKALVLKMRAANVPAREIVALLTKKGLFSPRTGKPFTIGSIYAMAKDSEFARAMPAARAASKQILRKKTLGKRKLGKKTLGKKVIGKRKVAGK